MRIRNGMSKALFVIVMTLSAGAWPASVKSAERIYTIGFLGQTRADDLKRQLAALSEGLRAAGYAEGENLIMEYRWAEHELDRLPALAAELAALKVDVIVTHGSAGSRAAKQASQTIPVVIAVIGYPVESGVVASLAHPGGNVTGLVLQEFETTAKWLELLRQVLPTASKIGWLDVPGIESTEVGETQKVKEDGAARMNGFEVQRVVVRGASDLPSAFERLAQHGAHAVVVPNTSLLNPIASQIASLAKKYHLASIGSLLFARAGGLIGYGPDGAEMYRRAARYVDVILKGARAADLPMEGPPKFELAVNLATAKALSMTLSREIVGQANQKIE